MRNQFFGDYHDFCKYVWLRKNYPTGENLCFVWMLRPDFYATGKRKYLLNQHGTEDEVQVREAINNIYKQSLAGNNQNLLLYYLKNIFPNANWIDELFLKENRISYFQEISKKAEGRDLFIDPDTGISLQSTNEHIMPNEIKALGEAHARIHVYQHKGRYKTQEETYQRILEISNKYDIKFTQSYLPDGNLIATFTNTKISDRI